MDDVVRSFGGMFWYSQLKTGGATTWTADADKLASEFAKQGALCQTAGVRRFQLELVTPDSQRAALLRSKMPASLADTTKIVLFPLASDPRKIMQDPDHPIRPLLKELCAYQPDSPDHQRSLLLSIITAWTAVGGERSEPRRATAVLELLRADTRLLLKNHALALDAASAAVIQSVSIAGLQLRVENGYLCYQYGALGKPIARLDTSTFSQLILRLQRYPQPPSTNSEDFCHDQDVLR